MGEEVTSASASAEEHAHALLASGLTFTLYGTSFGVRIVSQQTTVQRDDGATRWRGTFVLEGVFSGTVTGVLQVEDDGDWAFGFGQELSVAGFLSGSLQPVVSSALWDSMRVGLVPVAELFTRPTIVIANKSGEVPVGAATYWYQPGVNFYDKLDVTTIEPFRALLSVLPPTGPCLVQLRITWLWNGPFLGWIVDGFSAAKEAIIPEVMWWKGLEVYLTDTGDGPTLGVVSYFAVKAGSSELALQGGFECPAPPKKKIEGVVWAALDSAWKNPFGIRGVTITQLGAQMKIPWAGWIDGIAFRGGFTIGTDALDGDVAWLFDSTKPENNVVHVESESGIALDRLLRATLPGSYLPADLLAVRLERVTFHLAPKGGWVAGKYYDPGFALAGTLDLWGFTASVAGRVDYLNGAALAGEMQRVEIRASGTEVLTLAAAEGAGGPAVRFEFTTARQALELTGQVRLFGGAMKSALAGGFTKNGFYFTFTDDPALGMYRKVGVVCERGVFRFTLGCGFVARVNVAGVAVSVSVTSTIGAECSRERYAQDLTFKANLHRSFTMKLGAYATPLRDAAAVKALFDAQLLDDLRAEVERQLATGTREIFQWVEDNVTKSAADAAKMFESVGVSESTIAKTLCDVYDLYSGDAVKLVADSTEEAAAMLKHDFGKDAKNIAKQLEERWGLSKKETKKVLKSVGFSDKAIDNALQSVWGGIKDIF